MKSLSKLIVSTAACLVLFPSTGNAESYRNSRPRTVDGNATGISVVSRIHGGADAAEGQFKYMVFLLSYGSENHRLPDSTCSASLIHPSWVLTAAHCVSPAMIAVAGRANLVLYWLNRRLSNPFREAIDEAKYGVQERKVRRMIVHPQYSTQTNEMDLALLYLDEPFNMAANHWAPVAVLPLASDKMNNAEKCTVMGWGLNDFQEQTFRLMFASPVYAQTPAIGCRYLHKGPFICLLLGGGGICRGDSGSPLVCSGKAWGVASFSLSPIANPDCTATNEEYYAQIYPGLEWIRETLETSGVPAAPATSSAFALGLLLLVITASW